MGSVRIRTIVMGLTAILGLTAAAQSPIFEDVPANHPFFAAIQAVAQAGLMDGCSQAPKRFCPADDLVRGHAAIVSHRVLLH